MKVWLVWSYVNYEGDELHGIFSTEEKAKAFLEKLKKQMKNKHRDGYDISYREIDDESD